MPLSILFISRKHPPSIGGMQRLSHQLITHMRARVEVYAITWGGSQIVLPLFLIIALLRGLFLARHVQAIHAGDPLVMPVAWLLARLYHLPIVVTVHGLDITFNFPGYQRIIPSLLRRCDRIICISAATYADAVARGLAPERCRIIYPGIEVQQSELSREAAREHLEAALGKSLTGHQLWLTVGRLVPRKGVAWFIQHVLPGLSEAGSFVYLVSGDGPEMPRLRTLVAELGLEGRVFLLGRVSDADLTRLYAGADAFIMPNIPQPYDREGFGMVAIEAAAHHLPVIGARLQGIQDAVIEGESGYLLPSEDVAAWSDFLQRCMSQPELLEALRPRARAAVIERFSWDKMSESYEAVFREALVEHTGNHYKFNEVEKP